jgi:sulfoxide reductase heme-binding subunit YedZ
MTTQKTALVDNPRFYILLSTFAVSALIYLGLDKYVTSDTLFLIRLEQFYGFISLIYLYIAVLLSPLATIVGKDTTYMRLAVFCRRAIGVSAFYFAFLHFVVALFGQLGGIDAVLSSPSTFFTSIVFGGFALCVLLIMAITSFDRAIELLGISFWKWLHRLVYLAGIAILVHIWLIGTHVVYGWVQLLILSPIILLLGLESLRITDSLSKKVSLLKRKDYYFGIAVCIWVAMISGLLVVVGLSSTYHFSHSTSLVKENREQ